VDSSDNEIWVKPSSEAAKPMEEAKKRESQSFSIVTRSTNLMDAVEDVELEEDSGDVDAGLLINDEVMGDPYTF
jgi:hypothetical protein